jgi:hypothetical protein
MTAPKDCDHCGRPLFDIPPVKVADIEGRPAHVHAQCKLDFLDDVRRARRIRDIQERPVTNRKAGPQD